MKIASAASETAELPVLTDPLEAPGHPLQLEALFRNTVEHAPVAVAEPSNGRFPSLQSGILFDARIQCQRAPPQVDREPHSGR